MHIVLSVSHPVSLSHIYLFLHIIFHAYQYKVDINAKQLKLTGCAILWEQYNIVIVEGGPKAMKRFTRLMLHRIKWDKKVCARSAGPDFCGRYFSRGSEDIFVRQIFFRLVVFFMRQIFSRERFFRLRDIFAWPIFSPERYIVRADID
jgi:hypothetical protein